MLPLRVHAENFLSWEHLDLDLSDLEAVAIVGRNGAGKTGILEAMYWALYGTGGAEQYLRTGARRMIVTLEVEEAGMRWRIVRGRERGGSGSLTLERRDGDVWTGMTQRKIADTQDRIQEYLTGMDAASFCATVYSPQGKVGWLADLTPSKRKELLGDLCGLGVWEVWRDKAATEARAVRSDLTALDARDAELTAQITTVEAQLLDAVDLALDSQTAAGAVADAEALVEAAHAADRARAQVELRGSLLGQLEGVQRRAAQSKRLVERRAELVATLADADAARDTFAELDAQRREHDAVMASYRTREEASRRESAAAAQRQQRAEQALHAARGARIHAEESLTAALTDREALDVDDALCPTCNQPIKDEAHARVRIAADSHIDHLRDRLATAGDAVVDADSELDAAKAARAAVEIPTAPSTNGYDPQAWETAHADALKFERAAGEYESLADPEDLDELRAEYTRIKTQADALPKTTDPTAPTVAQAQRVLSQAQQELRAVEERAVRAAERTEALERLRDKASDLAAERDPMARRLTALETATRAFSRDGVPALILDSALSTIEAHANDLLERTNALHRVRLDTQRTTQKDTVSETLDIIAVSGLHEWPVQRLSGGEAYRVHLALRAGLAAAIAGAGGPRCDFLWIDEVTAVDAEGIDELGEVLAQWPDRVLVVSHHDTLSHAMPTRLHVTKAIASGQDLGSSHRQLMTELDLTALRRIAAACDEGGRPWFWHASEREGGGGYPQQVHREGDVVLICTTYDEPDGRPITPEFIAAFDPPTVLALLDLARRAS